MAVKYAIVVCLICSLFLVENANAWRKFWKGRRDGGNLLSPTVNVALSDLPPEQWITQKLDHFNESNNGVWQQVRT